MVELKLYGRDYSLLSDVVCKVNEEIIDEGLKIAIDGNVDLCLSKKVRELLAKAVLDKSGEYVKRNRREGENKEDDLYTFFNGYLRFGGYVGVLSTEIDLRVSELEDDISIDPEDDRDAISLSITLQIQSRFDISENEEGKIIQEHPFFLATMLMSESNIELSGQVIPSSDDEFFDFLLLLRYKDCLQDAYLKGFYRTYQTFEKNDDRVKGAIDVARHIKDNLGLSNGRVAYRYREKSIDNYLNHLIVAAYYYFKKIHPDLTSKFIDNDIEVKNIINNLAYAINYPKYDNRTLLIKNLSSLSHPYYTEYEQLRIVALRMLRNEGISIFDGNLDDIEGILYYLPDLFELFLERLFNIPFVKQAKTNIFSSRADSANYIQKIRPDFVFTTESTFVEEIPVETCVMILDAKFKPGWGNVVNKSQSLGSAQLLSDYDKCIRDMNSFNCHATGVVFPTNIDLQVHGNSSLLKHFISKYNMIDCFYTIPLYVPGNTGNYEVWSKEFNECCKETVGYVNTAYDNEKTLSESLKTEMENLRNKRNAVD